MKNGSSSVSRTHFEDEEFETRFLDFPTVVQSYEKCRLSPHTSYPALTDILFSYPSQGLKTNGEETISTIRFQKHYKNIVINRLDKQ